MDKKKLMEIAILALFLILMFMLTNTTEKPKPGTCKTDEDCKLVRCVGAYCNNSKCVCPPEGEHSLDKSLELSGLSKDASDLDDLLNQLEVEK